jgi:hypothetical protein
MATTTNYGWTTPDDTSLVKDGAAAIRTLGSSVDTTTKALNPSTTLGDIEYRSSTANTNTRLGIGTTGQVLTVSGGVPAWATSASGGWTLISTSTLTGGTFTISSIPQTYTNLRIVVVNMTNNTGNGQFTVNPNGSSLCTYIRSNAVTTVGNVDATYLLLSSANVERTDGNNSWCVDFISYANTTASKPFFETGMYLNSSAVRQGTFAFGSFVSNSAITSLVFENTGGTFSGGTVYLYGGK